jgi:hypothetical protein
MKELKLKSPRRILTKSGADSEIRYRRLFETAQDGILILDAETGMILDVNPFLIKLLGYSKVNFIKKEIWEIGFFKDIAASKSKFLELQKTKYVRYENLPLETADGRKISVEFVSNVYLVEGKKVIQCNIRDITERIKSEEALLTSENRLRTLLQTIPDLIWLKDTDGIYLSCNKMFGRFLGKTEIEIVGKTDYDFIDKELADFFRKNDRKAILAGKPTMNEEWITFADDGHKACLETIKAPMYDKESKLIGILGIGRDITVRKNSEEEMAILSHALKSVNESVSITDINNKILFVNESFLKTYGYAENELLGKNITLVRPHIVNGNEKDIILAATISGEWQGEILNRKKDGSVFPVYLSTSVIKGKENKIIGLIGVATDISERKRAETELIKAKEKAEESDRLKSAFLSNMSHEIRTPMNGILGFTGLLKQPKLSGEEQKEYISIIEKSGERLLGIINDIICISKVESGHTEVTLGQTNINEQVEYIYNFFKNVAKSKHLHFAFNNNLSLKEAMVSTDREKVYAILTNLVNNAIKFTESGGVEFGYIKKGNWLEFYIIDSGTGVPESQKELIFERFRQGSELLTRAYEGAGLGLAISKAYVEMLGGKIWVQCNSENTALTEAAGKTGSSFYFTIPYVPVFVTELSGGSDDTDENIERHVRKLKILIADDDEISQALLTNYTRQSGREILKVSNGRDAVDACRNNPDIELVLMDIKMPLLNGYEATRQIREFNKTVIIIAQTAYGLDGDREKAIEAGCDDYISKPHSRITLNRVIARYFNWHES